MGGHGKKSTKQTGETGKSGILGRGDSLVIWKGARRGGEGVQKKRKNGKERGM